MTKGGREYDLNIDKKGEEKCDEQLRGSMLWKIKGEIPKCLT